MDINEAVRILFTVPLEERVKLQEEDIRRILESQTDKVTIDVRELDITDISKKVKDPAYLNDEFIRYTDTGIKLLYATENIAEILKKYLPRTVKEISIPSEFLSDLSFLQEFPNLETINLTDYGTLTKEQIEYIANNTSVTYMNFRSSGTLSQLKCQDGAIVLDGGSMIGQYGKLTMYHSGYQGKWRDNLNVYTTNFDPKTLATIGALYDGIKERLPELSGVTMSTSPTFGLNSEFDIDIRAGKVTQMEIKGVSPTIAANMYRSMKKRGTEIEKTRISLDNATYDDIYRLKQMNETSKCTVRYKSGTSSSDASYDEFLNMRATIDYYKELIEANDLSPVEKVAYVYDILKTMRYQESHQDKQRSRNIHSIVTDGSIVCVGYAVFAEQLLKELGVTCMKVGVTCLSDEVDDVGHARNFVRVDDDKYNIHGLYAMDITWDSDKEIAMIEEEGKKTIVSRPNEEQQEKVVDKYDSLILYRHFLIPMSTYEQRYPQEINPSIYEAYKAGKAQALVEESRKIAAGEMKRTDSKNMVILDDHARLFSPEEGHLTVERYFDAPKPSLETFEQILTTVRHAQGYNSEETKQEVDRVVELHQMLAEQNSNSPNHFFKPTSK
ncbi:MAG: hypothetical protein J6C28_00600 [Bacilli bacterium]|nr:hypothetical protein [Bacilli bacterium]